MSAIAGLIEFDGRPIKPESMAGMLATMRRRSPDGLASWSNERLVLGQGMLRSTPESFHEILPLANEDASVVLVLDGRVDNRDELTRALLAKNAVLRSVADAELLLRAYEIWGEACVDRVIGEWAFVIWDARQQHLFAARDPAGTRHFHYHAGLGWFAFASEINALLSLGRIERRLNETRILDYLLVEYDRDDEVGTFFEGICRLPAGHAMRVWGDGVKTWRYWDPGKLSPLNFATRAECAEAFREQLEIAVSCRLRSCGPVAAMLSGGLDSSSIVALISKRFRQSLSQPLQTFSLIGAEPEMCKDAPFIQEMLAGDSWLSPHFIRPEVVSGFAVKNCEALANEGDPFYFAQGLTESLVCDAAQAAGCRVILDGMAGDLMFFGLGRSVDHVACARDLAHFPAVLAAHRQHEVTGAWRQLAISSLRSRLPAAWFKQLLGLKQSLRTRFSGARSGRLESLISQRLLAEYLEMRQQGRQQGRADSADPLDAHAALFRSGMLSFGHEVNSTLAKHRGLDPRSPFSDRRMIEFAVRMPAWAKLSLGWYKRLLREAMQDLLPEKLRWRRNIVGHPGWQFFRGAAISCLRDNVSVRQQAAYPMIQKQVASMYLNVLIRAPEGAGLTLKEEDRLNLMVLDRWLDQYFSA